MPKLPSLHFHPFPHGSPAGTHPLSPSLLADCCTSMRQLVQVHANMIVTGRISDNYAASRVLSFAALHPTGHLPHAMAIFSSIVSPNSYMFNTLIRALADSPDPSRALHIYPQMLLKGPPPGRHTFPFLLKATANTRDLLAARQIHTHAFHCGLYSDPYVANGLIRSYGLCGLIHEARQLFDETPEKNAVVWTTMVSVYVRNFCASEAVELFCEMMQRGVEPCDATLASVLSACARLGGLQLGRQIHLLIRQKGIDVGIILGTALVDMYAKNGEISLARDLFVRMPEKNIATWNAMICGSAHYGHASYALELFHQMEETIRPNEITIVGVLTSCCYAGKVDFAQWIFRLMEKKYGIEPKVEHYGCMVDLLGRNGRLKEAEELVKEMKWEADVAVLGALLSACRRHGEIEIAERVVESILRVEPENHGVYVVLSNMYAEIGRWEDAERLRRVMRHVGLKKISGWSCFDGTESSKTLSSWDSRIHAWGYRPMFCSVECRSGLDILQDILKGRTTVVMGPSGVGKSSLINCLRSKHLFRENEVVDVIGEKSGNMRMWLENHKKTGTGKHATHHVSLHPLSGGGFLADTPGFNLPSLLKVSKRILAQTFPEIRYLLAANAPVECSFTDCLHIGEPGCVINLEWERYPYYFQLLDEIKIREEFQLCAVGTKREADVRYKMGEMGAKHAEPRLEAKKHRRISRKQLNQTILDQNDLFDIEGYLSDGRGGPK